MTEIIWAAAIRTVSEANKSEHWTKSSKRHKAQQFITRLLYEREKSPIPLPCEIRLIRLGPRLLDKDDNLPMAFKWIKDELSECLFPETKKAYLDKKGNTRYVRGRADDNPLVTWKYDQEKTSDLGVRIEIRSIAS